MIVNLILMNVKINNILVIFHYEKKKALITGITGQDGSYLAEFLLKKKII